MFFLSRTCFGLPTVLLALFLLLSGCGEQAASAPESPLPPVATLDYYGQPRAEALATLVAREVAQGRTPVLYFYADWCGPCRRFRETLPDELLKAALAQATLIKVNVDEDAQGLAGRYGVQAVPTFVKLNARLEPVASISGDKWEEDVPENIAPVMQQLVTSSAYDTPLPAKQ